MDLGKFILLIFLIYLLISNYKCKGQENMENITSNDLRIKVYNQLAEEIFQLFYEMGLEWWVGEGTLIGMLRWGGNFGKIEDGILVTDTDIDIMVRIKDEADWKRIQNIIKEKLKKNDLWKGCVLHNHNIGVNRFPKLTCYTNIDFGKKCYGKDSNIHVDIHSYFVNESNNTIYFDPICESNPNKCKDKYPFQVWGGKAKYRGLIVDDKGEFLKAKFNNMAVPCPYKYLDVLSEWNNFEYGAEDLEIPKYNCILNNEWEYNKYKINSQDKKKLEKVSLELDKKNYASFSKKYYNCRHDRDLCFGKNKEFYNISVNQLVKIYNQFQKNNLKVFLSGGTLLGYQRESNLLRNDDDLDITLLPSSFEDFTKLEKIFKKEGYKKKIYYIKIKNVKYPGQYTFYKFINGFRIEFDIGIIWKDTFNNNFVLFSYFKNGEYYIFRPFQLKQVNFLNNYFFVPENVENYLSSSYGPDWNVEKNNFKYTDYNNINMDYNTQNLYYH
ncbi:hypothetical protein CPAV1605_1504 [seawater metagenome]|uniref:LicD/FKTN/FKRP nucleotidyltransferase domain-containing protein n=1 Tax=seawater metagenome TaxID=1561972 RepID=A0A5E8CK81_9ZZZZ